MQITRDFLVSEAESLSAEIEKANNFLVKAHAVQAVYQMLIDRLDTPEPEQEEQNGNAN